MGICYVCGHEREDTEFEKRASEILGPSIKLYDFGSGVNSMPIANPNGDGWLRTSVCYIYEIIDGKHWFMAIELEPKRSVDDMERQILARLPLAKGEFYRAKTLIEEGGSFPKPKSLVHTGE